MISTDRIYSHLSRSVVLAWLVATPALAGQPVAEFSEVGGLCLSDAERATALEKITVLPGAAITLIGYSDAHDLRVGAELTGCLAHTIPESIQGHERVAVARALHVYELANRAGVPGFAAPPAFRVSFGEATPSSDTSVVTIAAGRAAAQDTYSRRVEMVVVPPPPSAAVPPPPPPTPIVVPPARIDTTMIARELATMQDRLPRVLRAVGWTEFGAGLAVTMLGGAFLLNGAVQHRAAGDTIDPERAALLEADGYQYVRAGGWAAAVGVGLVIGGVATLAIARRAAKKEPTAKRALAVDACGVGVRW